VEWGAAGPETRTKATPQPQHRTRSCQQQQQQQMTAWKEALGGLAVAEGRARQLLELAAAAGAEWDTERRE